MLFGHSLRKRLLVERGDGRVTAPLRAFGKLEVASEFIEVNCDEAPEASWFRNWVREGWKRLEIATPTRPLEVRDTRLVVTTDGGRAWIVACLWDSADRRSDQGHQRTYPFTLFVVVPAQRCPLSALIAYARPIWEQLERTRPELKVTADRGSCTAAVRAAGINVAEFPVPPPDLAVARQTPLTDWATATFPEAADVADVLVALQARRERHGRRQERVRPLWRLPLATPWPAEPQATAWLQWLHVNARPRGDFGVFLPQANPGALAECFVLGERVQSEDFVLASTESAVVSRLSPALDVTARVDPAHDAERLRRLAALLPRDTATWAQFVSTRLPRR